jgi:hypothetical protein
MSPFTLSGSKMPVRFAGALLIGASAGLGMLYAYTTGSEHGPILGALSVAMALGLEIAKPFSVGLAYAAARSRLWGSALAMAALATVAVGYSLTAELSLLASARGDLAAERGASIERATLPREDRTRVLAELQQLGFVRPTAEIEADLAKAKLNSRWRKSSQCKRVTTTASAELCGKVRTLEAELARAQRAHELSKQLDLLSATIANAATSNPEAVGASDPGAAALSTYLGSFGLSVTTETVSCWMLLAPIAALELGSTLAVLAASLVSSPAVSPRPESVQPPAPNTLPSGRPKQTRRAAPRRPAVQPVQPPATAVVLNLLAKSGGQLALGQRAIGRALGISKSRVGQVLHRLAGEGAIDMSASRSGTMVTLSAIA